MKDKKGIEINANFDPWILEYIFDRAETPTMFGLFNKNVKIKNRRPEYVKYDKLVDKLASQKKFIAGWRNRTNDLSKIIGLGIKYNSKHL